MGLCATKDYQPTQSELNEQKETKESPNIPHKYIFSHTMSKNTWCRVIKATEKECLDKDVAIKIFSKTHKNNGLLFENEVAILSSIDHPNIVQFIEAAEDHSYFYIVTKLHSGQHLFDRAVNDEYQITEKRITTIMHGIIRGVQYLHSRNIIHRNLTAKNIIFENKGFDANIKLIGFEHALFLKDHIDDNNENKMGSLIYKAPELLSSTNNQIGSEIFKSADIWSIGIIAYILIIGTPPFMTNAEIVEKEVDFPTNLRLNSTEYFMDFIRKILNKNPMQRLTVEETLRHPWIQGVFAVDNIRLYQNIKNLRQFNYRIKLENAISKCLRFEMETKRFIDQRTEILIEYVKERYITDIIIDKYLNYEWLDCWEHFELLDNDGDGFIDYMEMSYLLRDIGFTPSEALIRTKKMLESGEKYDDGIIDLECFQAYWYRLKLSKLDRYIHAIFNVLDDEDDGYIDVIMMVGILGDYFAEIIKYVTDLDKNGVEDGKLLFDEFQNILQTEYNASGLCSKLALFANIQ